MIYSFFGTCHNDHKQVFACLKTIISQSIVPREIILVNSGDSNIESEILGMINPLKIKLIYIISATTNKLPQIRIISDGDANFFEALKASETDPKGLPLNPKQLASVNN